MYEAISAKPEINALKPLKGNSKPLMSFINTLNRIFKPLITSNPIKTPRTGQARLHGISTESSSSNKH
ncbi:hypothetical protein EBO34_14430 [Alteribacter keqinensis]|uniref:Uncharacterized protein n=1 Tax=Alteribacter keqinensis TaxID=2483800 RepID=A0A3M7TQP3_9BACI|nr:hypothetical protein EBO34_14430 [Alteribacter keqinensis]